MIAMIAMLFAVVRGRVTAGVVVAGAILAGVIVGTTVSDGPTTEQIEFTVGPASWDSRVRRAALNGHYGSTRSGLFWQIPAIGGGSNRYVYWTHNDGSGRYVGVDPGEWVSGLSGYTGIEVQLAAGNRTAAQVTTATCSALAAVYATVTCGATTILVDDEIDADAVVIDGMYDSSIATRQLGARRGTPQFTGNPLNGVVGSHVSAPSGTSIVYGVGIYLTAHSQQVRLGVYTGGGTNMGSATVLQGEGVTTGSATGWQWVMFEPDEVFSLTSGQDTWILAKSNSAVTDPGYTLTSTTAGFDFTVQNMLVFSDLTGDPSVTFAADPGGGSDLNGTSTTNSPVFPFVALLYRPSTASSDTLRMRVGVHTDDVLAAVTESDLLSPDASGANVMTYIDAPALLGMQLDNIRIAVGATHSQQFRLGVASGGAYENINGATVIWDAGQTSGSSTNAWNTISAPTGGSSVSVSSSSILWAMFRGNGGVTVRYAANAAGQTAVSPAYDPTDLLVSSGFGDGPEYETNTGNSSHSTNDAVAYESPLVRDAVDDLLPGNYPGIAIGLRIPPDTAAIPP